MCLHKILNAINTKNVESFIYWIEIRNKKRKAPKQKNNESCAVNQCRHKALNSYGFDK